MVVHDQQELSAFLQSLSVQAAVKPGASSSVPAIGHHSGQRGDLAEIIQTQHHHLTITESYTARWHDGRRLHAKQPGTSSFVPAGLIPHMQAETPYRVLLCLLHPSLLSAVEQELDTDSGGDLQFRVNIHDPALIQLTKLLHADAAAGCRCEQLYREHLTHALALRILSLQGIRATDTRGLSPLPPRQLRRVIERMNELGDSLTLEDLARESGYSRTHFLRMFHAATGRTPHEYLMHLRVERAQEMIRKQNLALIDVATACGYSSHSHMTRAFRKILGVTPSAYQRHFSSRGQ